LETHARPRTRKQLQTDPIDEGYLGSGSKIRYVVVGAEVVGAEMIYTSSRSSSTPSSLMTHEMDLTMKIWPGCGRNKEPTEKAILFDKETTCTTPT
jgi:hypothetical protein